MIVLIPSYKRIDILNIVIRSVLDCDTKGIDERILILIANNFFPNKQVIDSIASNFIFKNNFEYKIIHREKTIPAIENWFSAIFSTAKEDEVICLLGDDDILMPWGLANRYHQIRHSQADMLLSDFYQRLYFFEGGKKCWLDCEMPSPPDTDISAVPWEYLPANHPEASFMSNHCYRNTESFRRGFECAMIWCRTQEWVPVELATGNCPFYLAYAIKSSGGKVVALHEKDVLRGSLADEAMSQDYSDGGNTSFYCLLIYNTFSNATLHHNLNIFRSLRMIYKKAFIGGIVSILGNRKIQYLLLKETMSHSKFGNIQLFSWAILNNTFVLLKMIPFLRGYRLKRRAKTGSLKNTEEFLSLIFNSSLHGTI